MKTCLKCKEQKNEDRFFKEVREGWCTTCLYLEKKGKKDHKKGDIYCRECDKKVPKGNKIYCCKPCANLGATKLRGEYWVRNIKIATKPWGL